MKRTTIPLFLLVGAVGLAVWILAGFKARPGAGFDLNYGSSLMAVHRVTEAVKVYYKRNGSFPFFTNGLTRLQDYGVAGDALTLAQLLNTNTTPVPLSTNTICVVSIRTIRDSRHGLSRYVGLLSGDVIILPVERAKLGAPFESGNQSQP